MFSGIIEEKAKIKRILRGPHGCKLTVECGAVASDVKKGDSISVNGVCLTAVEKKGSNLTFDVMEETLRRSNLAKVSAGNTVNVERPLKVGDRISGHFVTGHVDCMGKISSMTKQPNKCAMDIEFPPDKAAYVAEKGSVAIDGVSLTIAEIRINRLRVYLIPLTLKDTNLGSKRPGDEVNIEFDILCKYALQNVSSAKPKMDEKFLKEHGFL